MMTSNKKILGFMVIHYAGDYLQEALLSVRDYVDKMVVAYSYKPSQGYKTTLQCPDTRDEIFKICNDVLGDEKLIWDEKESYSYETEHRNIKYKYAEGFDAILTVDADEIMLDIPRALHHAFTSPERHFGIKGYYNFFRSFNWYCSDGFRPIRIEIMGRDNQRHNLECPLTVLHFSCAQRREIMEYKYSSFGHASEIRPNYLEDVFYKWSPDNKIKWLHPVSLQIWEDVKPFNKELMPDYLQAHKNFNLPLIP